MADLEMILTAVRRWVERAATDPRCKAMWLEGPSPVAIRRHDGPLDLHIGVEDPDFDAWSATLVEFLSAAGTVQRHADGPAEPDAFATVAEVEGIGTVTCTLERMPLIGKRPRVAVQPIFDRTERLRQVFDYSGATRAAAAKEAPVAQHPDVLDNAVIAAAINRLPNWKRQGGEILASYRMTTFLAAVTLLGKVALAAEKADHHPDMLVQYRKVSFSLTTHEAGGLTQKDLDLAARIEGLAEAVLRGRTTTTAKKAAKKPAKKKVKKAAKKKVKTKAKPKAKKKAATKAPKKTPKKTPKKAAKKTPKKAKKAAPKKKAAGKKKRR